jgi:hypothetical protein
LKEIALQEGLQKILRTAGDACRNNESEPDDPGASSMPGVNGIDLGKQFARAGQTSPSC